jgi:hypothetical protein
MNEIINFEQIEIMKQVEGLLERILLPFLIGWLFFKIVEYLTNKITIRDYEYRGSDLSGGDAKVIWYFSENDRNINGIKYSNNKYYFKAFTQFFKGEVGKGMIMSACIEIDVKDKNTYDFSTIVIFDKKEMDLKTRFKLIKWLVSEAIKNKIESNRNKNLPKFLIDQYIFTDGLYLNNY